MRGSLDPKARCWTADLVYDTKTQPLPSGVRSAVQRARRVLYTADQTELMLQMSPDRQPAQIRLIGQVLDDGMPVEGATVSVRGTSGVVDRATDEDGEFRVVAMAAGSYDLDVETATQAISVAGLDID